MKQIFLFSMLVALSVGLLGYLFWQFILASRVVLKQKDKKTNLQYKHTNSGNILSTRGI